MDRLGDMRKLEEVEYLPSTSQVSDFEEMETRVDRRGEDFGIGAWPTLGDFMGGWRGNYALGLDRFRRVRWGRESCSGSGNVDLSAIDVCY
jgi:hypothetical protein